MPSAQLTAQPPEQQAAPQTALHKVPHTAPRPAIFLDRDGVIIENRPAYVRSWAEVSIYPQALAALARASACPYKIVLVTNQSAIGRGIISLETAQGINTGLVAEIERSGGRIDAVFMCPHAPEAGCDCRKPRPGLFFQAAQALSLDLSRSVMIGDAITDLQAAQAAGVSRLILVRTGRGARQEHLPEAALLNVFQVCEDLAGALAGLTGPRSSSAVRA
jgi:D-glycero-D-manno-heptose 1,7-bisphosphate phosphatase